MDYTNRGDRRQLFRESPHHRWDRLSARMKSLRWLEIFIRRSHVPSDYAGFWQFWNPLEARLGQLVGRRPDFNTADWLVARGHLLRLADDVADLEGQR